jgi:hypothetical protein
MRERSMSIEADCCAIETAQPARTHAQTHAHTYIHTHAHEQIEEKGVERQTNKQTHEQVEEKGVERSSPLSALSTQHIRRCAHFDARGGTNTQLRCSKWQGGIFLSPVLWGMSGCPFQHFWAWPTKTLWDLGLRVPIPTLLGMAIQNTRNEGGKRALGRCRGGGGPSG